MSLALFNTRLIYLVIKTYIFLVSYQEQKPGYLRLFSDYAVRLIIEESVFISKWMQDESFLSPASNSATS